MFSVGIVGPGPGRRRYAAPPTPRHPPGAAPGSHSVALGEDWLEEEARGWPEAEAEAGAPETRPKRQPQSAAAAAAVADLEPPDFLYAGGAWGPGWDAAAVAADLMAWADGGSDGEGGGP